MRILFSVIRDMLSKENKSHALPLHLWHYKTSSVVLVEWSNINFEGLEPFAELRAATM